MHGAHHHPHDASPLAREGDRRRLAIALALILALMCLEVATGVLAHSLALLSDAAHMLTDAAALGFSLVALRLASRPAGGSWTFGFRRVEILSAQASGVTLLVLAAFIVYEAIVRLVSPPHVRGWLMLAMALTGIAVNLLAARTPAGADRASPNVEGSFQHVLTDLYGFIGTAIASALIF